MLFVISFFVFKNTFCIKKIKYQYKMNLANLFIENMFLSALLKLKYLFGHPWEVLYISDDVWWDHPDPISIVCGSRSDSLTRFS